MSTQVDITIQNDVWHAHAWHGEGDSLLGDDISVILTHAVHTTLGFFDMGACEISVVLADDCFIQNLNKRYRNQNKPTNVLSFPAQDAYMVGDMVENLGDIIISFDTLMREADAQQKTPLSHCIHLIVHGTLHVLGYDHMTLEDAQGMENLEREILAKLHIDDPYAGTDGIG